MFKNYLKITLRNLYRERLYALINIFGLSLGIGCCLILGLYINNELSYDRHHSQHENIYRVVNEYTFSGKADAFALSSRAIGPLLKLDFPEAVKSYTRFQRPGQGGSVVFRNGNDFYSWENVFLADVNVFDVFSHEIILGDPQEALTDSYSIAVSETFAKTYFGDQNPMGESLSTDAGTYKINLIFADLPENTHLKYDVLFSYNRLGNFPDNEATLTRMLGGVQGYTYLLMFDDFEEESFPGLFKTFQTERFDSLAKLMGQTDTMSVIAWAQNLTDIHLDSDVSMDEPTGNKMSLYGFSAVAIFILLIAVINYINLATARSMQRSREVGMRKVLGAERQQLIFQFLGESLFFVLLALGLALLSVQFLLQGSAIETLLGTQLSLELFYDPLLFAALLGASLLIGFISGLYPAFYLSSVAPVVALAGGTKGAKGTSGRLRQFLVFVQFTLSIGIISSTLLMMNQMQYISNLSLGFDKENKLIIPLRGANLIEKISPLRNELLTNPNVLAASASVSLPGGIIGLAPFMMESQSGVMEMQSVSAMNVGEDFIQTMNINLLQGRDFTKKFLTDVGNNILVNETLVQRMGWEQPLGKRFGAGLNGKVIGVVEDFHFDDLHKVVAPLIMVAPKNDFSNASADARALITQSLILSITDSEIPRTLNFVRDTMTTFDPTHPFEFDFMDERLAEAYQNEQNIMKLTGIFAFICVFISCLGLFGLASFTTDQRTREIGIRKVLGASSSQIVLLLSSTILKLVLFGSVVASIISYYAINQWLSSFAYRVDINWLIFSLAAALAIAVAFLTITLQSLKTVRANPVLALRYE